MTYDPTRKLFLPLNGDAVDYSGNGNTGTLVGGPSYGASQTGLGIVLNGTTQYVSLARQILTGTVWTVSAWIKTSDSTHSVGIYCERSTTTPIACQMYLVSGKLRLLVRNNTPSDILIDSPSSSYADGSWHHMVGIRNNTVGTIYVDGVQVGTVTNAAVNAAYSVSTYSIGANQPSGQFFPGTVSALLLSARSLSLLEIQQLYMAGKMGLSQLPDRKRRAA